MKYFVYVLRSLRNGDIYIGSTSNVENRLKRHNSGLVKSTKGYRLWELLEYREVDLRSAAVRLERFLKTHQQKEILRRRYG